MTNMTIRIAPPRPVPRLEPDPEVNGGFHVYIGDTLAGCVEPGRRGGWLAYGRNSSVLNLHIGPRTIGEYSLDDAIDVVAAYHPFETFLECLIGN